MIHSATGEVVLSLFSILQSCLQDRGNRREWFPILSYQWMVGWGGWSHHTIVVRPTLSPYRLILWIKSGFEVYVAHLLSYGWRKSVSESWIDCPRQWTLVDSEVNVVGYTRLWMYLEWLEGVLDVLKWCMMKNNHGMKFKSWQNLLSFDPGQTLQGANGPIPRESQGLFLSFSLSFLNHKAHSLIDDRFLSIRFVLFCCVSFIIGTCRYLDIHMHPV